MSFFEWCKVISNASSRKLHVCYITNHKWTDLVLANCFKRIKHEKEEKKTNQRMQEISQTCENFRRGCEISQPL